MASFTEQNQELVIKIDTSELEPAQVRLLKSLNSMLYNMIVTKDEAEYFEGSAEFMRMCAALIKQSRFVEKNRHVSKIPYADQALEFSMDILEEHIGMSKVVTYDN